MSDPNVLSPEWEFDRGTIRGARVAAGAGARDLGGMLYELDPGAQAAPYHLHHANEELLVVLAGRPELRTPAGTRVLEPGAVVAFVPGPDGAHRLRNTGDEPCRYLMLSTKRSPEIAEYPDTGGVLAMTGEAEGKAFPGDSERVYADLVREAMAAED